MTSLPTTRWSLIQACGGDGPEARRAWSELLAVYQPVVRAFFRSSPRASESEDLAQQFLLQSYEAGWWQRARPASGTFRRFLYVLLRRFLRDALVRASPDQVPIDDVPDDPALAVPTPDFDRVFLATLTDAALAAIRLDYVARGRRALFDGLRAHFSDPGGHGELAQLADRLGLKRNTLLVEKARFRERLKAAMQREWQSLCDDPAQAEKEWLDLVASLRG